MTRMRRMLKTCGLPLAVVLSLHGCASMAPPYSQPTAPLSAAWPSGPAYAEMGGAPAAEATAAIPWQRFFSYQRLQGVIGLALTNNRDLRLAALAIERQQAQYQIQRAALVPTVDGSVAASGQRIPADLSNTRHGKSAEQYNVGVGVTSYELDLFGRVRSLRDQALAQFLASQESRRAVQISLVAEVAATYLNLAADGERLLLARETLKAQEASFRLIERRFQLGASSELDLRQAETRVDAARVDIARFTTVVAQDENGLVELMGCPLPVALRPLILTKTLSPVGGIAPGLPSSVLLGRPDVLAAEEELKGMNANIGAARAAFLPRITLVGSLGTGSDTLFGLFNTGSLAWNFAPRLTLPIFDSGSRQAALKVAEVDRDIAVARYEKTIQTAFREVADALAQQGTIDQQVAAQQALADATAASCRLSQARFDKGLDSYLGVLDSQRSLYAAQQGVIATRLARLLNQVTLYKVLGGGGEIAKGSPDLPEGS